MFYEQIIKLCSENGERLTPLLSKFGMSKGNIEKWRKGVSPTGDTLLKFAGYFNVSTDYLLTGKEIITNEKENEKMKIMCDKELIAKGFKEVFKYLNENDLDLNWLAQNPFLSTRRLEAFQTFTAESPDKDVPTFTEISAIRNYTHLASGHFGLVYKAYCEEGSKNEREIISVIDGYKRDYGVDLTYIGTLCYSDSDEYALLSLLSMFDTKAMRKRFVSDATSLAYDLSEGNKKGASNT